MDVGSRPVAVASDDEAIQQHIKDGLDAIGYSVDLVTPVQIVGGPALSKPLIIHTGQDVAALCQAIYHLHDLDAVTMKTPVIVVLDPESAVRNPRLGNWMIRGIPAVTALFVHGPRIIPAIDRVLDDWRKRTLARTRGSAGA